MKTFTYERARTPAQAAAAAARKPGAKFIAGGTNLLDLMKLEIETPTHLIDVNGLALDKIDALPDGGVAHRRAGAQYRSCGRRACAARLRRTVPRTGRRCIGPTAQHGHHCGQSAAANAVSVFFTTPTSHAISANPAAAAAPSEGAVGGSR